jgi:RNA polymerase sigma factor (sigma-70 family)
MNIDNRDRGEWIRQALAEHERHLLIYSAGLVGDLGCARDVVQDAFLKLCKQSEANVKGHVKQWLFTVCRNRCYEILRKEKRMTPLEDARLDTLSAEQEHPADGLQRQEDLSAVLGIIQSLPSKQQEVVRLKFQSGLSYKEISKITSLSVSHVGVILHESVVAIRKQMGLSVSQAAGA